VLVEKVSVVPVSVVGDKAWEKESGGLKANLSEFNRSTFARRTVGKLHKSRSEARPPGWFGQIRALACHLSAASVLEIVFRGF
jgi:hypothetical protein